MELPSGPLLLWLERDPDDSLHPIWLVPLVDCPQERRHPGNSFLKRLGSHQLYSCDTPAVIQEWFDHYFLAGHWTCRQDLRLYGTLFQQRVWRALAAIPFGARWTYGQLAAEIGQASAVRAVANALGANPLPVLLPCHRVVYHNGAQGGFALGHDWKARLLAHEGTGVSDILDQSIREDS